jgi:hypothetical protein
MKRIALLGVLLLILGSASACTLPFTGTPTPFPTPTELVFPTAALTNTPPPTEPPPPSPTPFPSNTPAPSATPTSLNMAQNATQNPGNEVYKVRFQPYRTGVTLSSTLPANQTQSYLIRAQQDQNLIAEVLSPQQDLELALFSQNGVLLPPAQITPTRWNWLLPSNQEYRLDVIGSGTASDYTLEINIPRNVHFPIGTYGTTETGQVGQGEVILYRLRAALGQTMTLNLTPTDGSVVLGVYGMEDDAVLLSPGDDRTSWSGELTGTSSHFLVQVVGVDPGVTDYTIQFDIR